MNFTAEQILQILFDRHEVKQQSAGLELDGEIAVAVWSSGAPRDRAKDANTCGAIRVSNAQNGSPVLRYECGAHHVEDPTDVLAHRLP